MEKIDKSSIFSYLKKKCGFDCYVGLHGIADSSDLINEYSHLSKIEKVNSILKNGLINGRGESISHTVRVFGDLNEADSNIIDSINNYGFYSPSGQECIVVVAIPEYFEDSKNRKLYGGIKNYRTSFEHLSDKAECITDFIFRNNIPREMILGYYTYNNNSEVTFYDNPNYYTNLSQYERDQFILKFFDNNRLSYDVNDKEVMEKFVDYAELRNDLGQSFLLNTVNQYKKIKTQSKEIVSDKSYILTGDSVLDLCVGIDNVLNDCNHISNISPEVLMNFNSFSGDFKEWLDFKKIDWLKDRNYFKNNSELLDSRVLPFDIEVEKKLLSSVNKNDILNSFVLLPVYTLPVISGNLNEDFRLKFFQKMMLDNDNCVVVERTISNSELQKIVQSIIEKINKEEMNLGRHLTDEEKNKIISSVASQYGMENLTSFDLKDYSLIVDTWDNYKKLNDINVNEFYADGESMWNFSRFEVIDNRLKEDNYISTLKEQLLEQRKNKSSFIEFSFISNDLQEDKKKNIDTDTKYLLLEVIAVNYNYKSKLIKMRKNNFEKISLSDLSINFDGLNEIELVDLLIRLKKENEILRREIEGISLEEFNSLELNDLDLSKIPTNFESVVNSKFNIKQIMIFGNFDYSKGLANLYGFDLLKYENEKLKAVSDFEQYMINRGFDLEKIYKDFYEDNMDYWNQLFLDVWEYRKKINNDVLNKKNENINFNSAMERYVETMKKIYPNDYNSLNQTSSRHR